MAETEKATEKDAARGVSISLASLNSYALLHDAYYGTGLFENGAGLRRHPRESIENYMDRQALAYYWNYTGPIVNAMVDPIFKDELKREYKQSKLFQAFLDDCDRTGMTYKDFCRAAALQAKLYGVAYVVVDNSDDMDPTLDDAVRNRHLPFLKLVTPPQIKNWAVDKYGRLTMFQYEEHIRNGANSETINTYTWTDTEWFISSAGETRSGTHTIGQVPVVQWLARNTKRSVIKPPSEYLSVAQSNYFLFQLCSWHTQILRDQAFSILTIPDGGQQEIVVGTNNVLAYPPESNHTPAFIAPDSGPAQMLCDQMDRTIKEMFRMSGLESVINTTSEANKSGAAKKWDFEKTNKRLADFASRCESADKGIIALYEKWAGEDVGYNCEYPRDFSINDVADSLAEAQSALDLGFESVTYKQEVLKRVLAAYMPNLAPEVYDEIVKEVADTLQQAQQEGAYGDEGVGEGAQKTGGVNGDEPEGNGQNHSGLPGGDQPPAEGGEDT